MKKITLIFALMIAGIDIHSQSSVTIPDVHFVNWLTVNIPSAMTGNQMDTTNSTVISLTTMNVSFDTICNLEGIRFFKSLKNLNCSGNKLDTLLELPDSLQTLVCSGNIINYLQEIPDSVIYFDCSQNLLDTLPALPATLDYFNCQNNALLSLPALPPSIHFFDCTGNQLSALPPLPPNLPMLNCAENQLTSLPALPGTLTSIFCENNLLTSLPALPLLLNSLYCGANQLSSLPILPDSLTILECYTNQLTGLPALPSTLQSLICGGNMISALPALPASLITLKCYDNQLSALPTLPLALNYIDCRGNLLSALTPLPASLTFLDCSLNSLTALPSLSTALQNLNCSNNMLSLLPALPSSLVQLSCSFNPLIDLPALPLSLNVLDCSNATLDSLPSLPAFLYQLDCSNNSLITLPALPSISSLLCNNNLLGVLPALPASINSLTCHSNNINCFDEFPTTLSWLDIGNNPFTCLPNYLPVMDAATLNYPLCIAGDSVNNPHGCTGAEGIVGYTYTDMNSTCSKDSADGNLSNIPVYLFDGSGLIIGQTYTAINGIYHFPESAGNYSVRIDTTGMPIGPVCASPGIDSTVLLTASTPLITNINFDFNCKPGFDLGVRSVANMGLVFPGQTHQLRIDAGDMTQWYNMACAAGMSGQVSLNISGPVTFAGTIPGSLTPVITGSTYTYSISDFGAIVNTQAFGLMFTVATTAGSGNQICVNVDITPGAGDNDTTNNTYDFCYEVVNSHDPNIKETYPQNVPLNYDDWFTYTIQFQNTGNAPAINIRLKDTLDSQLNLSTFQAIGYSHTNQVMLNGNELSILFPNIYLSDSTSSADSSRGFFQYRIKPMSGLGCSAEIKNTASIYFDFNAPVVTNTTVNAYPVNPEPPSIGDTTVCYGTSIIFTPAPSLNSISWFDVSNTLLSAGNSFTLSDLTTSTVIYAQTMSTAGCGSAAEAVNITVQPLQTSPLLSVNDTLCFTDTLQLSASALSGWNYYWSGPAGFSSVDQQPVLAPLSTSNTGIYTLYVSNSQCLSDTAAIYLQIDSLPLIFVSNNPDICLGDSVDLHASGNLNSIVWSTGEATGFIWVQPTQTTLYDVSGQNTCGSAYQNILVEVHLPPIANAGSSAVLIEGESTPLHSEGGIAYAWFPQEGLSCSNCSDPMLTISQDQQYIVIVTDEFGCSDTAKLFVDVVSEGNTIYVPNSFSPNEDGLNDRFMITGKDLLETHIIIYARSGDIVFESKELNAAWDGRSKDQTLEPTVFIYTLEATFINGERSKRKGTITLIR